MTQYRYEANLAKIVKGLHDMADRIERDGKTDNPEHAARKAGQVVHELAWGTANLTVESLIASALDWRDLAIADVARGAARAETFVPGDPVIIRFGKRLRGELVKGRVTSVLRRADLAPRVGVTRDGEEVWFEPGDLILDRDELF